jgi:hypothetical protein
VPKAHRTHHHLASPHTVEDTETGYLFDRLEVYAPAMSELVNACEALPYFDTFQIVHGYGPVYGERILV